MDYFISDLHIGHKNVLPLTKELSKPLRNMILHI